MLANFFKGFLDPDQLPESEASVDDCLTPATADLSNALIELPSHPSASEASESELEFPTPEVLDTDPSDTGPLASNISQPVDITPVDQSPMQPEVAQKSLVEEKDAVVTQSSVAPAFESEPAASQQSTTAMPPAAETSVTETNAIEAPKAENAQAETSQAETSLTEPPTVVSKISGTSSLATMAASVPVPQVAAQAAVATSANSTVSAINPLQGEAMVVFVRQAKAYMQNQEWEKAIAACEEALAVAPDIAEAHKMIGNVLQEMGRGIDSMGHYARALLANPAFPEVYANLGTLYARNQVWGDAEIYYRKALALRPEDPAFLKPLTKVLEAQGKSDEAMQMFAQRVKLDADQASPEEHFLAGNFFLEAGDEAQAIASYRKAVELDEDFSQAYRPLADLLEKQGDWQTATLYYRKVLQAGLGAKQPDTPGTKAQAPLSHGTETATTQRISAGHTSLQQLLKDAKQVRQNNAVGQSLGGVSAFAERGQSLGVAAASQNQAEVLEKATNYARSGQLQAEEKNWPRAIEYYQESLKLNPRQPEVYRELARVLTQAKQIDKAVMAWFQAFKLEPDWASAEQHYNLANNLVKQGKLEEATVCYKHAVRLNPELAAAYENLGRVLELQNDPSGASVAYRKALEVKGAVTVKK